MRIILFLFFSSIIILHLGCSKDISEPVTETELISRTLTLRASMPTDYPTTRITLEEIPGSLNLSAKWRSGDKVKLFIVQGNIKAEVDESPIFEISANGKQCSFNIQIPESIDLHNPFDIYAFSGIHGEGSKLTNNNILADISPIKSVSMENFSAPVWSVTKNVSTQSSNVEIVFSHLGAYEIIHLKNSNNQSLTVTECFLVSAETNSTGWYYNKTSNLIPVFNPETGSISNIQGDNNSPQPTEIAIGSGSTKSIISWYMPNGENIPELSLKMNSLFSANTKVKKDYPMQSGHAYHIYAVWDGSKLTITQDDYVVELPKMTLTTSKSAGETISFYIDAANEDKADVWIDLNNNGIKDNGENIINFGNFYIEDLIDNDIHTKTILFNGEINEFTIISTEFNIYGKITSLYCYNNQLTDLEISNNPNLKDLYCVGNNLSQLNVSSNIHLEKLLCSYNQLTNLDIGNNKELKVLWSYYNKLSELDLKNNTSLTELLCYNNQLSDLDLSKNINLETLWCYFNPLSDLDISNNLQLSSLDVSILQLSFLNISNNIGLKYLNCSINQLLGIDITKNIALETFRCNDNQLIYLDVSKCTELKNLKCHNNLLTCIQVNQSQLNNIPTKWEKDFFADYSIECD